jgi:hypothetical protein
MVSAHALASRSSMDAAVLAPALLMHGGARIADASMQMQLKKMRTPQVHGQPNL